MLTSKSSAYIPRVSPWAQNLIKAALGTAVAVALVGASGVSFAYGTEGQTQPSSLEQAASAGAVVRFVDTHGTELAPAQEVAAAGESYDASSFKRQSIVRVVDGVNVVYELVGLSADSAPEQGSLDSERKVVVYVYDAPQEAGAAAATITVRYVDQAGRELASAEVIDAPEGTYDATSYKKETLTATLQNDSVPYSYVGLADGSSPLAGQAAGSVVVTLVYAPQADEASGADVVVRYIAPDGDAIAPSVVAVEDAAEDQSYDVSAYKLETIAGSIAGSEYGSPVLASGSDAEAGVVGKGKVVTYQYNSYTAPKKDAAEDEAAKTVEGALAAEEGSEPAGERSADAPAETTIVADATPLRAGSPETSPLPKTIDSTGRTWALVASMGVLSLVAGALLRITDRSRW